MTLAAVPSTGFIAGAGWLPEPLRTLAAMVVVLAVLGALLGILRVLRAKLHPEWTRKLLHVGMGLAILPFPWLFSDAWPVVILVIGATGLMLALRLLPSLERTSEVIHGVGRGSWGEVYFPLAMGALWLLSGGQWVLWVVPVLVLTLADALAALIGISYGRFRFVSADGAKSVEGSVAFFAVAFLSAHVPLLLFTDVGRAETLLIAVILGLLVMLLELLAWDGLDNLFIPLGAFAMLSVYLDLPVAALVSRLVVTLLLVGFVFLWRRRTSLDDSALVAAAFFGYLAWAIGGAWFLLPPLVLFLAHGLLWPRTGDGRYHSVRAVLMFVAAGLLWLLVYASTRWNSLLLPYAVTFGFQITRAGISFETARHPLRPLRRWAMAAWLVPAAWAVTAIPAIWILRETIFATGRSLESTLLLALSSLVAIGLAAAIYVRLAPRLFMPDVRASSVHAQGAVLSLVASIAVSAVLMAILNS